MSKPKKEVKCMKFHTYLKKNNISSYLTDIACLKIYQGDYCNFQLEFKSDYVIIEDMKILNFRCCNIKVKYYTFENYWYDKIVNFIFDFNTLNKKYIKLGEPDDIEYEIRQKKLNFIGNL